MNDELAIVKLQQHVCGLNDKTAETNMGSGLT
jgi:hypothetical protein